MSTAAVTADRASAASPRAVDTDQGHAPPLGPDGRQDAPRAHADAQPLVERHAVPVRSWTDDAANDGRGSQPRDRDRPRRPPAHGPHDRRRGRLRASRRLSVAEFHRGLTDALSDVDVHADIRGEPFGVATTTPFSADHEHASYDTDAVARFLRVLQWSADVLEEFAGWYCGKASPVQLFWHSFDLATSRFSGDARRYVRPIPSKARRTRTRSSASASGPETGAIRIRRTTPTPRPSRPGSRSRRFARLPPSGVPQANGRRWRSCGTTT